MLLTRKLHLYNDYSRHMCIKTFTKQDLDILCYQFVIYENMNFAEYQMSYRGAAGKAFSVHMPIYIPFLGLIIIRFGLGGFDEKQDICNRLVKHGWVNGYHSIC